MFKELRGLSVELQSWASTCKSSCWKCLQVPWRKLGVYTVLCTLVFLFIRCKQNKGNWKHLGSFILTLVLLLYSWQVQNGLALYATWTTIATLLNFAVVLIYKWDVSNETATTACLSILTLMLVMW